MSTYTKNFQALFCFFSLLLSGSHLSGTWDPQDVAPQHDLGAVTTVDFLKLKRDVSTYLSGSWCSQEKIDLLMDLVLITKPKVCVEIGACTGSSVLPVAATLQYLKMGKIYAIDAWSNEECIRYLEPSDPNRDWWSKVDMSLVRNQFENMVQMWRLEDRCLVIHKSSLKAALDIKEKIDLLHMDGDYSERGSLQDVRVYLPKVRSGGYILLSNAWVTVSGKQPKKEAFRALYDSCEVICEVDGENTLLFRKR